VSTNGDLYEMDFYAWTQQQAALLREGAWQELDRANLIEEVESLGRSERHALYDRLIVLLTHLLKLQVARQRLPVAYDRNTRGWHTTCRTQRLRLARLLDENPSLQPLVSTELTRAYAVACLDAAEALQIDEDLMPPQCPWTVDQVLDAAFWPETDTQDA
jgi:hypothetical protein